LRFFYVTPDHQPLPERIRSFANIPKAQLAILNLPDQTKYVHEGDVTADSFKQFVAEYLNGNGKKVSLKE